MMTHGVIWCDLQFTVLAVYSFSNFFLLLFPVEIVSQYQSYNRVPVLISQKHPTTGN